MKLGQFGRKRSEGQSRELQQTQWCTGWKGLLKSNSEVLTLKEYRVKKQKVLMACIPGTRLNARPSLPGRFENDFLGSEFVLLIQFQGVQ